MSAPAFFSCLAAVLAFAGACSRAPSEELPAAPPTGAPAASSALPTASEAPPAPLPELLPREECARVTSAVNGGARALAELEQRRDRTGPDEHLDAVARELDGLASALERMQLETEELADFARAYARTNRRAAKVAREASSAAARGNTSKLAAAEADMAAAMRDGQPLLERTGRFCAKH